MISTRTRNVDVWPTVLDLIGLEVPTGLDGRSLVPEILAGARGQASPEAEPTAIAHLDQSWGRRGAAPEPTVAVARGSLRYVRLPNRGRSLERLFDSERDPRELHDRAAEDRQALERLRAVADLYLEGAPPWGEAPKRDVDELELNQLRALGYVIP